MTDQTLNTAIQGINSAAGIAAQSAAGKKTYERNKKMMGIQFENQQALNRQGQELGVKSWKETSYPAQMAMMREAGLNPALMYGAGGGGGSTGGGSGGSAASGSVGNAPIDLGGAAQMGMTLAQGKLIGAQTENIKAQARKANVEANVMEFGEQTEKDATYVKGQGLINEDARLQAERDVKGKYTGDTTGWERIAKNEMTQSDSETDKSVNSAILEGVRIQSEAAGIKLTDERRKAIWHEIRQKWMQAGFKGLDSIIGGILKVKK